MLMKIKYVIKKWNGAHDYWSYLRETPSNTFTDNLLNSFISGTVGEAKWFNSMEEAANEMDKWIMNSAIFQIETIFITPLFDRK